MELLKEGDKMYLRGSMSISNGSNDVAGGLATIKKIEINERLGIDHFNGIFVEFVEVPGRSFNYKSLMEDQDKLSVQYEGKFAHPDPDIDTPWIQDGDWVDGKIYHGTDIL
jgi:hypothetical protein